MTKHWLSFCDPELPKGTQFLGVSIVEAPEFLLAVTSAHALGCNPGGEVRSIEIPETINIPIEYMNRLLSKEEALGLDELITQQRMTNMCFELSAQEMPKYKCHKEVWALKIKEVIHIQLYSKDVHTLEFEDENYKPKEISAKFMVKHQPQAGGYYVQYEDGYESYSPQKAFEEGYTLIKDDK